ncbi:hypothetical protein BT96DRAFT_524391 [Gymnopus androsaceus JB14]|uniref:Uncharacterized protein n=1 Tax=Gymnopus androsaceus JB14 TaxID=1447944 RepID=A0A6A4GLL6_9AGAR|nr:hypothetical protein BT96DRAFT_524391 [Gymnopus androsaceus JB14]
MERPMFSQVVKHLEGLMSGSSSHRDRQADLSSFGSPPQQSASLARLYSDPPTDMYASKSSVPGQTEFFSKLNRSNTVRPRSQPQASSSQNKHHQATKISLQSSDIDILDSA